MGKAHEHYKTYNYVWRKFCPFTKIPPKLILPVFVSRDFTRAIFVTPLSGVCFTSETTNCSVEAKYYKPMVHDNLFSSP
jgi:hypothetical protein